MNIEQITEYRNHAHKRFSEGATVTAVVSELNAEHDDILFTETANGSIMASHCETYAREVRIV
jgi:hypothetical protein